MTNLTAAQIVLDSITPHGDATRLVSMHVVFPKMVLGERNRHRGFSLSDRSSRAVPSRKLIEEVRINPAMPAKFRRNQPGMAGAEEFTGEEGHQAQFRWILAANQASVIAEMCMEAGEAKETANRHLDPYIYMHSLMTATRDGWLNFFGLRLDSGADPTIQLLAEHCRKAWNESTPKLLQPGEWHLPYVDQQTEDEIWAAQREGPTPLPLGDYKLQVSAARCAHLSYHDYDSEARMPIEKLLSIYDRLVTSRPVHASPTEHQACPDTRVNDEGIVYSESGDYTTWAHPELHGNLYGWIQARKLIPGEAVAELPEAYRGS